MRWKFVWLSRRYAGWYWGHVVKWKWTFLTDVPACAMWYATVWSSEVGVAGSVWALSTCSSPWSAWLLLSYPSSHSPSTSFLPSSPVYSLWTWNVPPIKPTPVLPRAEQGWCWLFSIPRNKWLRFQSHSTLKIISINFSGLCGHFKDLQICCLNVGKWNWWSCQGIIVSDINIKRRSCMLWQCWYYNVVTVINVF